MNSQEIRQRFFQAAHRKTLLVIGDVMLDRYVWGRLERESPEAPVPVVDVEQEESRPGGAANVAVNLHALGAKVLLCGLTGMDEAAGELFERCRQTGFSTDLIFSETQRKTTTKTRIIGNQRHVIRIDREDTHPPDEKTRHRFLSEVLPLIPGTDGIILEDYDKGFLDEEIVQAVISSAQENEVPVVVDPKFRNFFSYGGCDVFKPNLRELNAAMKTTLAPNEIVRIAQALEDLQDKMPHANTLVTLGEMGAAGLDAFHNFFHLPALPRQVRDVSGAGDAVVAALGLARACHLDFFTSCVIANLAGGIVVERTGVVAVDAAKLEAEAAAFLR